MDDLTAFLRHQLDEDERVAQAAIHDGDLDVGGRWHSDRPGSGSAIVRDADGMVVVYDEGSPSDEEAQHIARWDPARVLAEVEAKRRVLDDHPHLAMDGCCGRCIYGEMKVGGRQGWPCTTVRMLAQPYAGRPGWREEWSIES